MQQLLPLDRAWLQQLQQQQWPARTLPIWTMESSALFASLVRQYLFVTLYRAFAESLASENASRLIAMQVAEHNIEERLAEFNTQFQQQRQTAITDEILEIVSGSAVLDRPS
jgi:F-type H+-transporting ATPase subunit gamma